MLLTIENPFTKCTARDMTYEEVIQYWCNPFKCFKLSEQTLKTLRTSIIIEGARGSGKTMILKNLSYYCHKKRFKENELEKNILDNIINEKYLGIYCRFTTNFSNLLNKMSCFDVEMDKFFSNYFHITLALQMSKICKEIFDYIDEYELSNFFEAYGKSIDLNCANMDSIIEYLEKKVDEIDNLICNASYLNETDVIQFNNKCKNFLSILANAIHCHIPSLKDVLFLIIIDEYENIGIYQKYINNFIKIGSKNISFRIGVRPQGMISYDTLVGSEFLQDGRDYHLMRLNVDSSDRKAYFADFVEAVVNKRLEESNFSKVKTSDIKKLLGYRENYEEEAELILGKNHKKKLVTEFVTSKKLNQDEIDSIAKSLDSDSILMYSYNLLRYNKGDSLEHIQNSMNDYIAKKENDFSKKYKSDFESKYKAALVFALLDFNNKQKLYYSFSTYIYLSCGSVNEVIGLCGSLFNLLESDYYSSDEIVIDKELQTKAARKYAKEQLDKLRINGDSGRKMYSFVTNMCNVFSHYHKYENVIKYPETNQFYFENDSINEENTTSKQVYNSLLKWGVIIKKPNLQRKTIGSGDKSQLYYINKIYYPIYDISCRFRGGHNFQLKNEMWEDMLIKDIVAKDVVAKDVVYTKNKIINNNQISLFDKIGDDNDNA